MPLSHELRNNEKNDDNLHYYRIKFSFCITVTRISVLDTQKLSINKILVLKNDQAHARIPFEIEPV